MKKLLLALVLLLLPVHAALAQDIVGTWQGTLAPPGAGRELRTVIKIVKGDALAGTFHSIDQGGQGLPCTVIFQGSSVRITIPGIGGSYEGRLDGNVITGTFTQGPGKLPLNLTRATEQTAWEIPAPPPPVAPMAATADPSFDVATIKPSRPEAQGKGFQVRGRQFATINTSLSDLISFAYGIHAKQITNAPPWIETEKYDITARPDGEGQPNDKQWKTMLQKLMADRFKLTFHRDKKELSVYAIVPARTGPKLTRSTGDPNGLPGIGFRQLGNMLARNASMTEFANVMQSTVLDRPVVDQSNITGKFDFTLVWTPDEFQFGGLGGRGVPPPSDSAVAPNLFTAIQEQLGLRLDSTKAPAEVFVVDRAEHPSEN